MLRPWDALRQFPLDYPSASLVALFVSWKLLLLTIAFLAPGHGYDSSTQLFFRSNDDGAGTALDLDSVAPHLATKLVRWDAIYLTSAALNGYVHEQEWAFSWGFTRLVKLASSVRIFDRPLLNAVYHGLVISNLCHLLSAMVLSRLAFALASSKSRKPLAFLTAALHVLSPAGIFLTAPYSESTFALVNFLGQYCYSLSVLDRLRLGKSSSRQNIYVLCSGVCFAVATSIRSNGLLSGLVFAYDVFVWFCSISSSLLPITYMTSIIPALHFDLMFPTRPPILPTVAAGLLVASGLIWPQYLAYKEFCGLRSNSDMPPWCTDFPPSIYTSVQSRYWNVGFLKYWTVSNIPLFLLSAPMLAILFYSAYDQFFPASSTTRSGKPSFKLTANTKKSKPRKSLAQLPESPEKAVLIRLALPQLALSILALTGFHVQIINRISSGYPIWYMFLASSFLGKQAKAGVPSSDGGTWHRQAVRGMVVYALVQDVLYSSFLPPA